MMGKAILTFWVILLLFPEPLCQAQNTASISDPRIIFEDNNLLIGYDIKNSDPSVDFVVTLKVTDVEGNRISARTLEGDIGENVTGGGNKQITWDLGADSIMMNSDIFITLYAEPAVRAQQPDEGDRFMTEAAEKPVMQNFNRAGIVLQSLAFPGLGLSRISGKPHWIRGASAYGCIAGSIILNRMAIATYDEFKQSYIPEEATALLSESTTQDRLSEVLAFVSIGIWVSDVIWTLAGTSDLRMETFSSHQPGISVRTKLNSFYHLPMIVFCYSF